MRGNFLAQNWQNYPPFPKGDGWIGGRLHLNPDGLLELRTQNSKRPLSFSANTKWRELKKAIPFSADILQIGDLVAIRWNDKREIDEIVLLVPSKSASARMSAVPAQHNFSVEHALAWANFVGQIREFFVNQNFIEALTPTLVPSPGTEPYLDAFSTEWRNGSDQRSLYLPTSPEFHLKKMLANGFERLFEIKTCFRNGELGEHHQPEFQMLEWYRAYSNLDAIAADLRFLFRTLQKRQLLNLGNSFLENSASIPEIREVSVAQLFKEHADFCLTPQTTKEELVTLCDRWQINRADDDAWDDLFFRIFLEKIERQIDPTVPHLVRYYPPSQAALSRILPNGWADRFEIYWRGLEIANAFHELNDPNENLNRFTEDAATKKRIGRAAVPIDENLIKALEHGLPPSGGIALGLDRLFMALHNIGDIADTRAFPFS